MSNLTDFIGGSGVTATGTAKEIITKDDIVIITDANEVYILTYPEVRTVVYIGKANTDASVNDNVVVSLISASSGKSSSIIKSTQKITMSAYSANGSFTIASVTDINKCFLTYTAAPNTNNVYIASSGFKSIHIASTEVNSGAFKLEVTGNTTVTVTELYAGSYDIKAGAILTITEFE